MKYGYFFYVIMGFLSGSILFGRLIPMIFRGVDVQTESEDGNPGTFNAFACGGAFCGILVLLAALIFWYLLFVIVISARSNTRKSVYTFLAFAVTVMLTVPRRTVLAGCVLMSGIVIHKHCLKANAAYRRGEEWRLE